MKSTLYYPRPELQNLIQSYRIIETDEDIVNRVLPNLGLAIVFTVQGQISFVEERGYRPLSSSILSGIRKSIKNIHYAKGSKSIIVLFTEVGAATFFKNPLHELFGISVELENFVQQDEIKNLEEKLYHARTDSDRIKKIDQFLLSNIMTAEIDSYVHRAVDEIRKTKGLIKVSSLPHMLHISQDAFEKRFRKAVGCSPKQFANITRLKQIITLPNRSPLIHIALEHGYYDQAHFNRDFKNFTGLSPADFYKSGLFW